MRQLRYFQPHEFACRCGCGKGMAEMDETLLAMLDELRHRVKRPLIVNSACRCSLWNSRVGGKAGSSHCRGFAVDIDCRDPALRYDILKHAFELGFPRIEPRESWIHLDIDPDKPQNVVFYG